MGYGMGTGRIAVSGIQLAGLKGEKTRNQDRAEMLIREAAAQGAQIVMTPEVVTTGFVGGGDEK
jgi:predicted amidohydrolase